MRSRLFAGLNVLLLLAFVFSVVVQVNDPDPIAWMALYGLAAAACLLAVLGRGHWIFPALLGLAALGWALGIAPRVLGRVPFLDMFGAFEMKSMAIEESREMYGLLIIAVWMAVLAATGVRRSGGTGMGSAGMDGAQQRIG
ncbi:MAG: transmembrane 220 family protein [Gemmatimonadota bacterium]